MTPNPLSSLSVEILPLWVCVCSVEPCVRPKEEMQKFPCSSTERRLGVRICLYLHKRGRPVTSQLLLKKIRMVRPDYFRPVFYRARDIKTKQNTTLWHSMCRICSLCFAITVCFCPVRTVFWGRLRFSGRSVTPSWPTHEADPLETKYSQVWKFQRRITRNLLAFRWCVNLLTFCLHSVFYFWKGRTAFLFTTVFGHIRIFTWRLIQPRK